MNKKNHIILLFLLLLMANNLRSQNLNWAYLEYGSNDESKNYAIYAQDQKTRNDDVELFYLTQGNRSEKISVDGVRSLTIYYKDIGYPVYVFPGDSLTVDCNTSGCFFKGNRENEWNLSRTLINKSYPFLGIEHWNFGSVAYEQLLDVGQSKFNEMIGKIDQAADTLLLSAEFVYLLKRDAKCAFIRSFIWEHNKYNTRDESSQQRIQAYVKDFGDFYAKDSLRNSFVFSYSLMSWSEFMARAANNFEQPQRTHTYVEFLGRDLGENYIQRLEMAKSMPGPNREDILYSLMTYKFKTSTWNGAEYEPFVSYFQKTSTNKRMVENILARSGLFLLPPKPQIVNNVKSDPEVQDSELYTSSGDKVSWKDLNASLKGKPTYVSFWASWCAPCIKEFRASKSVVEELAKNGNINFLAISVDEDKEKWIKSMKAMGMENSRLNYQMKLKSALGNLLLSDETVPRYMIIDANGIVRTIEASKLSSPGGVTAIQNLVNQK